VPKHPPSTAPDGAARITDDEMIVFVHQDGTPTGQIAPKLASHHQHTKMHLGFSCYVFSSSGDDLLVTQRAARKKVWPGVWTNSFCGHPRPDESVEAALRRRANEELGISHLDIVQCVLPTYTYRTPPCNGVVEHEFCPVYTAMTGQCPQPDPGEVADHRWVSWDTYVHLLNSRAEQFSYWAKDQLRHLQQLPPRFWRAQNSRSRR
jgi:isopentenyl-diphosphate Delta-isomerase